MGNFRYADFDSPDEPGSGFNKMSKEFLEILHKVALHVGPLKINSGYRSVAHNAKVGGEKDSSHLRGLAADISVTDSRTRALLMRAAYEYGITRMGVGKTFVHLDIDKTRDQNVVWLY